MGNKFRNALARFFYGRYGADNLYNALFVLELIFLFTGTVCNILGNVVSAFSIVSMVLYILSLGLIIWAVFRVFSRNIPARRKENEAYLRLKGKFRKKSRPKLPLDTAEHIFRRCTHCHSVLRLPRKPGKHTVKCPRCAGRFKVKVKKL